MLTSLKNSAARRLIATFHCGPNIQTSLRPLHYTLSTARLII